MINKNSERSSGKNKLQVSRLVHAYYFLLIISRIIYIIKIINFRIDCILVNLRSLHCIVNLRFVLSMKKRFSELSRSQKNRRLRVLRNSFDISNIDGNNIDNSNDKKFVECGPTDFRPFELEQTKPELEQTEHKLGQSELEFGQTKPKP